ncbi:MAG: HAD family phosphatase [Alphaproteobacteria bacterium]|nr:HAD family phosphatase [Alphaproteobacteria bacterium]
MNIVFDIGMVLIEWDPRHLYRKLFDDEAKMEWFLESVCTNAWNLEQDRGRLFKDAVNELIRQHPGHEAEIRAYDERWHEMIPGVIGGSVDILEVLHKKGAPLFAITNWNQEKFREAKLRFPFLNLFRDIVVSGDEKLIKPDPAIFHILLKRNNLAAEECLFIDDSLKNAKGAEAVGMQAHHFTTPEKLRADLKARGLL